MAGIILIQALDAGYRVSISTHNRCSNPSILLNVLDCNVFLNPLPPRNVLKSKEPLKPPQSFEALNQRAVAVVVDPIQSVKGKVVIDAFRLINPQVIMLGQEPRQTTSNIGHLSKPSIQALIHGLNRHYYSIAINYRKNELEEKMLLNLHKKNWTHGLTLANFSEHTEINEKSVKVLFFSPSLFYLPSWGRQVRMEAKSPNKGVRRSTTMKGNEQVKDGIARRLRSGNVNGRER